VDAVRIAAGRDEVERRVSHVNAVIPVNSALDAARPVAMELYY